MNDNKAHWENVYLNKTPDQVSWTQKVPEPSLEMIHSLSLNKDAKIIDIGGGDSNLVDHLLAQGYTDITVLDISSAAIDRAKTRLGNLASKVKWVVSDILDFAPSESYNLWHDRAAFHFLTSKNDIRKYEQLVNATVDGFMIMGTFSTTGPKKCSGLEISQYNEELLGERFSYFEKISCRFHDHATPFDTVQNFVFCTFRKD